MAASTHYAQKRLLQDLQEVLENPLPNVVGKPLDDNIFVWHVNVRAEDDNNQLSGGTFHLKVVFPHSYPNLGPQIHLSSPLPHPNVFQTEPGKWKLSLWDCIPGFKGWSSAYSAQSIFLQLQTFLLREDLQYDNRIVSQDRAVNLANAFTCPGCPHKGTDPFPTFHTQDELEGAVKRRTKLLVSRPIISQVLRSLKQSEHVLQHDRSRRSAETADPRQNEDKDPQRRVMQQRSNRDQQQSSNGNQGGVEEGWQMVTHRKHCMKANNRAQIQIDGQDMYLDASLNAASQGTLEADTEKNNSETASCTTSMSDDLNCLKGASSAMTKRSKTARKHQARVRRRAARSESAHGAGTVKEGLKGVKAMGLFGMLPIEALTVIISRLATSDLASLSMTCHGIKEACEDGFVWREILFRQFPATSLEAATMNDWKHAYMLESSNITSSLQCFHSKVTFDKDVLGYPITYTVNPRTRCVDYIEVSFDLLSQRAYDQQQVRTTASNEKFDLLLPLYINQEHFERGLPLLMRAAHALCPEMRAHEFKPEMVLNFMPKLLNTMVVLLCSKGISASERATDGFCTLHRLFIALCDRFNLWKEVEKRVLKFQSSEKARCKTECPSLGDFMALLTVCSSQETSWEAVIRPWVSELLDRGVIWVCKAHPHSVEKHKVHPKSGGVDEELLKASWDARKVGLHLAMFFCGFIHMVARPPGASLFKVAAAYDALYGMASFPMKKRIQDFCKRTMAIDSWPVFFKAIGLQPPSKEYMTGWLRQCWFSSLSKGYHTNNTDFSAIQKGGVSKILLKGETTHLGVNSRVFMQEKWRFESYVQYLDASNLLYDFNGRFIEVVDYCHTSTRGIRHSGDAIDYSRKEGTHTINIHLGSLGTNVKEMYFTLSGWMGVRLKDIRLPFVQLVEAATGKELCEYHLEDKNLGEHRSVVMCRLYRNEPNQSSSWYVEAIGHLGVGAADEYGPIQSWIEQRIQSQRDNITK